MYWNYRRGLKDYVLDFGPIFNVLEKRVSDYFLIWKWEGGGKFFLIEK